MTNDFGKGIITNAIHLDSLVIIVVAFNCLRLKEMRCVFHITILLHAISYVERTVAAASIKCKLNQS